LISHGVVLVVVVCPRNATGSFPKDQANINDICITVILYIYI